jgi:hypothetical protein
MKYILKIKNIFNIKNTLLLNKKIINYFLSVFNSSSALFNF